MAKSTEASPQLHVVVWDDAQTGSIASVSVKDIDTIHRAAVMQTLGWVLRSDEAGISIANERCLDAGDETYRGHTFIPRSLVKSETPFNLTRPRRHKAVA